MQNRFSKKLGIFIIALLTITTISAAIPFASATITSRPTVYRADGTTAAPVTIEAGTTASIDTSGMTITGAQVWLWLSTTGGSEINTALGDRPYAGPFLLSELVDTVTPHTYTFNPAALAGLCDLLSVDSPFAGEGRTYTFTIGNYWINGSVPLKVQGEDIDYWLKIADVTPSDSIAGSEIGVSQNRVHFLPGFYATPLAGAPETEVTVSGYALPTTSEYNVTEDGTTVLGLLIPETHDEGGWLWTGFSNAFNVADLGAKVPYTTTPSVYTPVNITVWENDTAALMDSWMFNQYWREAYLEDEYSSLTFRGDTGDYHLTVTLNTGGDYDVDMEYFPAFGTASIYLGNVLCTSGVALNRTGGARTSITVPALTTGDYTFCIKDNNAVMYNFTVHVVMVPYIYCTPDSGYVGDSFAVTGVNFLDYVGDYVTLYFQNSAASPYYMLMLNFTVSSSTWTTPALTVPMSYGGPRLVEARITDGTTVIAYDIFNVMQMIDVIPTIVDNNCSVIQVEGTGFFTGVYEEEVSYVEDWFFYIDNSMYFGDDEDWGSAINATGYILTEFVAAGFRPGRHEVHVIADGEGTLPWTVWAKDCFWVSTVDDPIVDYLEAINATVVEVNGSVVTLTTTVGELNLTISELDATIVALDGTIATLSTTVGNIQVDLTAIGATIDSISGNVATIKTNVANLQSSLSTVSSSVDTLGEAIGVVLVELDDLNAVITSLNGTVVTLDTSLGTIETSLHDLDASITTLSDDVAIIDTVLGSVAGTVTNIDDNVATIVTDLGTLQVDLSSVKSEVSSVKTQVDDTLPVTVDMMPVWIAVVLALIAAIGSIAGVFIIQRKIA